MGGERSVSALHPITKRAADASCRSPAETRLTRRPGQRGPCFYLLSGIVVDGASIILVADFLNRALRRVMRNGALYTLAGNRTEGYADGWENKCASMTHRASQWMLTPQSTLLTAGTTVRQVASDGVV